MFGRITNAHASDFIELDRTSIIGAEMKISLRVTCLILSRLVLICFVSFIQLAIPAKAQTVPAPVISTVTGSYASPLTVAMTASIGNIYFTTDGSIPTNSSTAYTSPITINSPTQINAVAYQSGTYSALATVYLDVDSALAPLLYNGLALRLSTFGIVSGTGSPAPVTQWIDLSGCGNNAFGVLGSQPALESSPNANPSINFNGTSQYLSLPSGFAAITTGASIFLVVKPNSPSTGARFFDLGNGTASDNIYMSQPSTNGADLHIFNGSTDSSVSSSSAITIGQFQLIEGSYNGLNTATIFTNGLQEAQNTGMQTGNNITRHNNFIGQASGGGDYYAGNIAEILVYASQLTASQRAAVETYFIQKYQTLSTVPRTPIISVGSGTLSGPTQVTITTQPDVVTYFTIDGSTPTTSSPVYCGCPLTINYGQTLKACSFENGVASSVATATYILNSSQWPAPSSGDMTAPTINLQLPAPTY